MDFKPVDLTALIPIVLVCFIVLIPVLGLTLRFAVRPIVEALARARDPGDLGREVARLAAHVQELEEEVIRLKNSDPFRPGLPASTDPLRPGQGRG